MKFYYFYLVATGTFSIVYSVNGATINATVSETFCAASSEQVQLETIYYGATTSPGQGHQRKRLRHRHRRRRHRGLIASERGLLLRQRIEGDVPLPPPPIEIIRQDGSSVEFKVLTNSTFFGSSISSAGRFFDDENDSENKEEDYRLPTMNHEAWSSSSLAPPRPMFAVFPIDEFGSERCRDISSSTLLPDNSSNNNTITARCDKKGSFSLITVIVGFDQHDEEGEDEGDVNDDSETTSSTNATSSGQQSLKIHPCCPASSLPTNVIEFVFKLRCSPTCDDNGSPPSDDQPEPQELLRKEGRTGGATTKYVKNFAAKSELDDFFGKLADLGFIDDFKPEEFVETGFMDDFAEKVAENGGLPSSSFSNHRNTAPKTTTTMISDFFKTAKAKNTDQLEKGGIEMSSRPAAATVTENTIGGMQADDATATAANHRCLSGRLGSPKKLCQHPFGAALNSPVGISVHSPPVHEQPLIQTPGASVDVPTSNSGATASMDDVLFAPPDSNVAISNGAATSNIDALPAVRPRSASPNTADFMDILGPANIRKFAGNSANIVQYNIDTALNYAARSENAADSAAQYTDYATKAMDTVARLETQRVDNLEAGRLVEARDFANCFFGIPL